MEHAKLPLLLIIIFVSLGSLRSQNPYGENGPNNGYKNYHKQIWKRSFKFSLTKLTPSIDGAAIFKIKIKKD